MSEDTKIGLEETLESALFEVTQGNPGAVRVCIEILKFHKEIDPDCWYGGVGLILMLNDPCVRGPKVWLLYKDVCGSSTPKMIAIMRGYQLGFISKDQLLHAIENCGDGIDVEDICAKVCARIPSFNLNPHIP